MPVGPISLEAEATLLSQEGQAAPESLRLDLAETAAGAQIIPALRSWPWLCLHRAVGL